MHYSQLQRLSNDSQSLPVLSLSVDSQCIGQKQINYSQYYSQVNSIKSKSMLKQWKSNQNEYGLTVHRSLNLSQLKKDISNATITSSKYKNSSEYLKHLRESSDSLKRYTSKKWFKKQTKKQEIIQPQYLMSECEIKQTQIMNQLFKKFDADGSGSLDMNEIYELFKQNDIEIDLETIKIMFNNQQFTLENFKNLNNSPESLKRFRDCMRKIRNKIKLETNKAYLPYSFEGMMGAFGRNMERDRLIKALEIQKEEFETKIANKKSKPVDLKRVVYKEIDTFVKIIESNDVFQQDLSNEDNRLFRKLLKRSQNPIKQNNLNLECKPIININKNKDSNNCSSLGNSLELSREILQSVQPNQRYKIKLPQLKSNVSISNISNCYQEIKRRPMIESNFRKLIQNEPLTGKINNKYNLNKSYGM